MTETQRKALALVNEVREGRPYTIDEAKREYGWCFQAVCGAIEQNAALTAENERLKALRDDDGELLTIAWMDGAHRSKKAHSEQVAALEARLAVARDVVEGARQILSECKVSFGVCACGEDMETHGGSHTPMDQAQVAVARWLEAASAAFVLINRTEQPA